MLNRGNLLSSRVIHLIKKYEINKPIVSIGRAASNTITSITQIYHKDIVRSYLNKTITKSLTKRVQMGCL